MLDEGHLTDSHGRTVDFTNTIIIMTSNLGATFPLDTSSAPSSLKFGYILIRLHFSVVEHAGAQVLSKGSTDKNAIRAELGRMAREHFSPEFVNRIGAFLLTAIIVVMTSNLLSFN
jgi:ATP-dependent Clp protease ATP-binding subunit ClpA